jgi:hypothetical protein
MSATTHVRVTIGPRVRSHLAGGSLFQDPDKPEQHGYGYWGQQLVKAVDWTRPTQPVTLPRLAADSLAELTGYMLDGARDDACYDPDAKGDVASARRLLRQLQAQGVETSL